MPDREELVVRRDASAGAVPPGEFWLFRSSRFSLLTRCVVVAEFATRDGQRSEVHRMLRSEEYFVVGPHGDNSQASTYYTTAEAAVEDALDRWSARITAN